MNSARRTLALVQLISKRQCSTPSSGFKALKETQKKFQVDDGIPVYLKGGLKDKILFQVTVALTIVGIGMSANVLYDLTFPKKQ